MTGQAISRWENGKTHPDPADLAVFCRITGANLFWLVYGEHPTVARPEHVGVRGRVVPKLQWDQLATGGGDQPASEFIRTHFECGERSFSTIVEDESNAPELMPGDSVVIDPDLIAKPGDLVLIKHRNQVLLRRARMRENHVELVPGHSDWASITVPALDSTNFLGVITEHARPRRR